MPEDYKPTITMAEQVAAAERELKLRHRVYPRRVANNQMTPKLAAHEIAAMEAIVETLRQVDRGERLI